MAKKAASKPPRKKAAPKAGKLRLLANCTGVGSRGDVIKAGNWPHDLERHLGVSVEAVSDDTPLTDEPAAPSAE